MSELIGKFAKLEINGMEIGSLKITQIVFHDETVLKPKQPGKLILPPSAKESSSTCSCPNHRPKKREPRTEVQELGSKLAARLLLSDKSRRIIVPTQEQMVGVNLLILDDEHHDLHLS
jgi:hypothetical protein